MFYLLSLSLCCALFFIVLAGTSVLCAWINRLVRSAISSFAPAAVANLLFVLRILPVLLASVVTCGFVLPALLKFEPRSTSEFVGWPLLGLAILGGSALIVMSVRAATILRSTKLVAANWSRRSKKLNLEKTDIPVYCLDDAGAGSVLAVLGFLRPRIFVTRQVVDVLTQAELLAAVEHERAHVTSFDNLKQLVFKITRIPRWMKISGGADSAWANASEIAADETALASGASVLDLSAALIKVAALGSQRLVTDNVAASHLVLVESGTSLQARVDHLQKILEGNASARQTPPRNRIGKIVIPLVVAMIAYATCVGAVLPWVHEALEALVR